MAGSSIAPRKSTSANSRTSAPSSASILHICSSTKSRAHQKGFTLYMVKAVFNGRGDDLVDLARSNLWA
jgi:hypothetical protein